MCVVLARSEKKDFSPFRPEEGVSFIECQMSSLAPVLTKDVGHSDGELLQLWQLFFNLTCYQMAAALLCWQTNLGLYPGHCVCMRESGVDECEWRVGDQKRNVDRVEGFFLCVYCRANFKCCHRDGGDKRRAILVAEHHSLQPIRNSTYSIKVCG